VQADPGNVQTFSAVAWNFAVALQGRLHVPVGLIVSCVGGSHIEVWMPPRTIRETSIGAETLGRYDGLLTGMILKVKAHHEADLKAWYAANPSVELQLKNQATMPALTSTATFRSLPGRLYNGMIHGLEPYGLRGVIWYQADGNMFFPAGYGELFQALIGKWRADWDEPLPFYFVEMNNMRGDGQSLPVQPNNLSLIREEQHAGLRLPGVGMVAAIDVGIKNPHFPNKKPVGERLARLALSDCYHLPMGEVNGPLFQGFRIEGSRIRLTFADADGLRVRGGGELKGFAIRGGSGAWVWASGQIDGRDIVVWSDGVPSPAAVRYAWAENPVISVENAAGLPLYPFRTDTGSKE
jgi:sialate O-acetylesterase